VEKKVIIAGTGALGSTCLQFLRNEDVKFKLIDHDKIESKNIMSQFHGKASTGKNKAQALQKTMSFLYGLKVDALPRKIQDTNVDALLKGSDLVLDCLDNFEARTIVQNYVRENGIDCLHGGLAANGEFGRAIWDEQFVIDAEPSTGAPTCEDGEFVAHIGIVSSYMAQSVHEFLKTGKKFNYQINPGGVIKI
jgi:molybdopterin/thiamine biosynthesis adenylyltransferase